MRLIDPDAAFDEIDERLLPEDATEYARGVLDAMQYIVNDAPTVDAEPVKRAHWIDQKHGVYKCSNCGNFLDFNGVNAGRGDANYCPHCGAKMDEEIEGRKK